MDHKIKKLVVDSGAFFKNVPLWEYGEEFYCVKEVVREIRDSQTKQFINSLPIKLIFSEPSASSIKFINDFTKKTGDYASLSFADVKVLALTYQLEIEAKGDASHLRSEPTSQRVSQVASVKPPLSVAQSLEGFFYSSSNKTRKANVDTNSHSSAVNSSNQENDIYEEKEDEDNYLISNFDFCKLEDHLALYPYIKGYLINNEDTFLFFRLIQQFYLLKMLFRFAVNQSKGGNKTLFIRICQNYDLEFPKTDLKHGQKLIPASESQLVAREFHEIFCKLPNFKRWFCHMITYTEEELKDFQNNYERLDKNIFLEDILDNLWQSDSKQPSTTEDDITDKLERLNVDSDINEEESDKHLEEENENSLEAAEDEESHNEENEEILLNEINPSEFAENEESHNNEIDEGFENDFVESSEECFVEEDEDDDDDGWITPSNIKSLHKKEPINEEELKNTEVACITGDFAMQNTLKHIGLHVLGVNGKLITTVRTFILRCHACFKTTNRMEKIFCPHCGNKTLKRVSVTLNPDGTQKIWISTRRPINIRGMKFSLPTPKGGKHAFNPILVEDQREAQMRASKLGRMKNNPMHEDYDARSACISPFTTRDIYSRSAQLGIKSGGKSKHRGVYYWELKNPNVPMSKSNNRRKR